VNKADRYVNLEKPEEVEALSVDTLKAQWLRDPCWDIEDTEGFEDHREELLAYRFAQEERWRMARAVVRSVLMSLVCPEMTTPEYTKYCILDDCAWWNPAYDKCGRVLQSYLEGLAVERKERNG
jgi:hypothetical protein